MISLAVIGLILAAKFLVIASTTASSAEPVALVVVLALMGSGGLGYFLDRRSAQASRLAQDAVSATDVFQRSLEEERIKRTELDVSLTEARKDLATAVLQSSTNAEMIAVMHRRFQVLERDLQRTMRDMNEIIRNMFTTREGDSEEFKVERWREVMTSTKLAVIQTNQEITIVFMSSECSDLLGYSNPDALIGQPVRTVIAEGDYPTFRAGLQAAEDIEMKEGSADPIALSMKHIDGSPVPVLMALGVHKRTVTLLIRSSSDVGV
jgi:PAS domain S-box-containing protein